MFLVGLFKGKDARGKVKEKEKNLSQSIFREFRQFSVEIIDFWV